MPHPFWCVVMRCEGSNPEGTPPPSVDRSCGHRVLQLQSRIRAGVQYSLCHLSPPSLSQLLRRYRWQAETCDHSIDDGRYAPRSMFRLGHHFHPDPLEWVFTCEATRESIFSNYAPRDDLTHPRRIHCRQRWCPTHRRPVGPSHGAERTRVLSNLRQQSRTRHH